jgi:type I restriction enzyme S subunit
MTDDLKPYPVYKDPGATWLGKVPSHWKVLPNRALFTEVKERDHPDEEMLSVTITRGVIQQKALLANSSKKDSSNRDRSAYKLVQANDIAYNKMRAWQGAVGRSAFRGIISPAYVVIRPRDAASSHYFHCLLRTPAFAKEAERWSYGITSDMWSLRPEHFKMIYSSLPPQQEQDAIVRYLDHLDLKINRFIRAKKKLIGLLNEQKQFIIHRAVTRGLDPNAELRRSGLEWADYIPSDWKTAKLSRLTTRIGDGLHGTPKYVEASEYHFINGNNLSGGCIKIMPSTRCVDVDEFEKHSVPLDESTLLLSINGTIGSVAFYNGEKVILGKSAAYINCEREIDRRYLYFVLQSAGVGNLFRQEVTGTTIFNLSLASIRNLKIAIPPLSEQTKIAAELEKETASTNKAILDTIAGIDLLREYRTRLVADVVTGKLDVRAAAAKLPDRVPEAQPLDESEELLQDEPAAEDFEVAEAA